MSTVIFPAVNTIAIDSRRPLHLLAATLVALVFHVRVGIRAVGDRMERRFAEFADVPYQNPIGRQQWEELWETEAELCRCGSRRLETPP